MANDDLTVLVKKADGTFERKKLSELSSAKTVSSSKPAAVTAAPVTPVKKLEKISDKAIGDKVDKDRIQNKPQITKPFMAKLEPLVKPPGKIGDKAIGDKEDEIKKPVLKKDDFISPLEDKLPPRTDGTPAMPSARTQEADEVLKKIKFFVSPDILGRLRSLIQLRLKDIRGEKEFLEELAAPVKDKGLGLDGRQAGEILRLCQEVTAKIMGETPSAVKPLKGRAPAFVPPSGTSAGKAATPPPPASLREALRAGSLPLVRGGGQVEPATTTPFNAFKHAALSQKSKVESSKLEEKVFKISPPAVRPVMQDVIAKGASVGPIDEIRLFNLVDFRRLSANPPEAAARFKQKLENLKAESYLLYMDALNAWRESPLYLAYLEVINNSLKTGQSLAKAAPDKDKIQLPEIKAVVEMEKAL